MEIKNLKNVPLGDIVQAITTSFADYFVQLSSDVAYWEKRFASARVDYALSFGMFDNNKLVGFIINGIDEVDGVKTAFNTGTGVTAAARGHKIIDQLYAYAQPYFKEAGVTQCSLEVIRQNERAIRVYERIGFHISKELKCFKGTLQVTEPGISAQQVPFEKIEGRAKENDRFYSWDNITAAVPASNGGYHCYEVLRNGKDIIGYFIVNLATGHLIQFETSTGKAEDLQAVLSGVATVVPEIKINNVDGTRADVIAGLQQAGLDNFIDQYEMQLSLS